MARDYKKSFFSLPPRKGVGLFRHRLAKLGDKTFWLDASKLPLGTLTKWPDQGPYKLDVSSIGFPPIVVHPTDNGPNIVRFDGNASLVRAGIPIQRIFGASYGTTVWVMKQYSLTASAGIPMIDATTSANRVGTYAVSSSGEIIVDWGNAAGGAGVGRLTFTGLNLDCNWAIWMVVRDGPLVSVYKDNVLVNSGTLSSGLINGTGTLIVGFDTTSDPSSGGLVADLAETQFIRRPLNSVERARMCLELRRKWVELFRYPVPRGLSGQWDATVQNYAAGASVTNFRSSAGRPGYDFNTLSGTAPVMSRATGLPGVKFDGSGFLYTAGNVQPLSTTNFTQFLVVTAGTQVEAYANILDNNHPAGAGQNWVWQRDNTNNRWYMGWYDSSGGTLNGLGKYLTPGSDRVIMAVRKNGTAVTLQLNKSANDDYTVGATTFTTASRQLEICGNLAFSRRFVGEVHEIQLMNVALTDVEFSNAIDVLANKWRIGL